MSAPSWMTEGCTDMQRDRINRDYREMQRLGRTGQGKQALDLGTMLLCEKLLEGR